MARLEEEEREQREADEKVTVRLPNCARSSAIPATRSTLTSLLPSVILGPGPIGSEETVRGDPSGTAEEVGSSRSCKTPPHCTGKPDTRQAGAAQQIARGRRTSSFVTAVEVKQAVQTTSPSPGLCTNPTPTIGSRTRRKLRGVRVRCGHRRGGERVTGSQLQTIASRRKLEESRRRCRQLLAEQRSPCVGSTEHITSSLQVPTSPASGPVDKYILHLVREALRYAARETEPV